MDTPDAPLAVLRLSRSARTLQLMYPYGIVALLLVAGGSSLAEPLGRGPGIAGALVGGFVAAPLFRRWARRTGGMYFELDRDTAKVCNDGSYVRTIAWSEVEGVERRWKHGLFKRGNLLCIVVRASAGRRQWVYASDRASKRSRLEVLVALRQLSTEHGFALAEDLGSGPAFTRASRDDSPGL